MELQYFVEDRYIDSRFEVTGFGTELLVIQRSMGGNVNRDYILGFKTLLERLAELDARLIKASLATRVVQKDLVAEGFELPLRMSSADIECLRKALHRSMTKTGQRKGASGGNPTKRLALEISLPKGLSTEEARRFIQFGRPRDGS